MSDATKHKKAWNRITAAPRAAVRRSRGLSVVELLIALAIVATVLVAVAFATDASFRAYSVTEEQANLLQRSRLGMHRVLTDIRTIAAHQPYNVAAKNDFNRGVIVTDTGISLMDDAGNIRSYTYDAPNKHLVHIDPAGNRHVVVRGVDEFTVKFEPMQSRQSIRTGGVYDLLLRATVLLTVTTEGQYSDVDETVGSQTITLSSSVVPRRNLW